MRQRQFPTSRPLIAGFCDWAESRNPPPDLALSCPLGVRCAGLGGWSLGEARLNGVAACALGWFLAEVVLGTSRCEGEGPRSFAVHGRHDFFILFF